MDGTSHVSVIIVKFREVRQTERRPGRQLLDNSKPALGQPSKAVGYRREREELLVLKNPGGPCISCLKYNSAKPRAQRHPRVLAPSYHATCRTSNKQQKPRRRTRTHPHRLPTGSPPAGPTIKPASSGHATEPTIPPEPAAFSISWCLAHMADVAVQLHRKKCHLAMTDWERLGLRLAVEA
jgi:hypothetical protein